MAPDLTITYTVVLSVAGEIDVATRPQLQVAMDAALAAGAGRLVLDLSRVTFMDSSGHNALVQVHRRAGPGVLVLAGASSLIESSMKVTGLDQIIPFFGSVEDALAGP